MCFTARWYIRTPSFTINEIVYFYPTTTVLSVSHIHVHFGMTSRVAVTRTNNVLVSYPFVQWHSPAIRKRIHRVSLFITTTVHCFFFELTSTIEIPFTTESTRVTQITIRIMISTYHCFYTCVTHRTTPCIDCITIKRYFNVLPFRRTYWYLCMIFIRTAYINTRTRTTYTQYSVTYRVSTVSAKN